MNVVQEKQMTGPMNVIQEIQATGRMNLVQEKQTTGQGNAGISPIIGGFLALSDAVYCKNPILLISEYFDVDNGDPNDLGKNVEFQQTRKAFYQELELF
uniref:Uncharacterized protein n=1 Tax=Romanomermis culicivorax TaxID=13658 RepID=A0A915LAQ5_ROMCU